MCKSAHLRSMVALWMGWFVILYAFQDIVQARLSLAHPDYAVPWSSAGTMEGSNKDKVYLNDPLMAAQAAWDSEYYLGIAVGGYDDPLAGTVKTQSSSAPIIKNYSFFPLYPFLMSLVKEPMVWIGMRPIAAAAIAGSVLSLLGTLAGMFALYQLTRDQLDESGAERAVFYMLIFPTAFFFGMIYTEGLFIGMAFWSLVLAKRGHWFWAGLLGLFAAWTRAHGAALAVPLAFLWWQQTDKSDWPAAFENWRWWAQGAASALPLAGYAVWRMSPLGQGWALLQPDYYGRGIFALSSTINSISYMFGHAADHPSAIVYLTIEFASVLLALIASIWLLRRDAPVGLFSLAVVLLSLFSGSFQSQARYMLIAPAMFILLAHFGQNKVFDRVWTMTSILLFGMSAMLFTFDFWVG